MAFSERLAYVLSFDTTSGVKSLNKFGQTAEKELGKADKGFLKSTASMDKAGAGLVALAGVAGTGLYKLATGALDTQQNIEALRQVVGDTITEDLDGWATKAADALGLSREKAIENATAFAQLGKMAGASQGDLGRFSTDLVQLGADFAAFKNVSPEKAIQDIRSAFSGSVEVMRKYGIFLDELSLKEALFNLTGERVTGVLTGQQKVMAINAELYRQGGDMIGQFARESNTLAGQIPILKANLKNMGDAIGTGVLPAVTGLVTGFAALASGANELPPEMLEAAGTAAVLATTLTGVAGGGLLTVSAFRKARKALTKFSAAQKGAAVGAGVLGVAIVAGTMLYGNYIKQKQKAEEASKQLAIVLADEADGVENSIDTWLKSLVSGEGIHETMEKIGIELSDVGAVISGDVSPATQELMKNLVDATAATTHFSMETGITQKEAVDLFRALKTGKDSWEDQADKAEVAAEAVEAFAGQTAVLVGGEIEWIATAETAAEKTKRLKEQTKAATDANKKFAAEQKLVTEATKAGIEEHEKLAGILSEQADALSSIAGLTTDVYIAQLKANEAVAGSEEALAELTPGTADYLVELNSQVALVENAGIAARKFAEEQAAANGTTLLASEGLDIQNGSLIDMISTMGPGPLRDAAINTLALVNGISGTHAASLVVDADVEEAKLAVAEVSGQRALLVTAELEMTQAERDKLKLLTPAELKVSVFYDDPGLNPRVGPGGNSLNIPVPTSAAAVSDFGTGIGFFADGTRHAPGGAAIVGERGPELVNLPRGAEVLTAEETAAAFAEPSSAPALNVTFSGDIYGMPSDEFWDLAAAKLNQRLAGRA